ncbi:MAG: endonuclease/exonuclease/phosphatase family protein [Cryomorphaceae bacterium]|nr:endonuclease/exonuclease/phosphatase family protein [Cryomorphaceae bacterium]
MPKILFRSTIKLLSLLVMVALLISLLAMWIPPHVVPFLGVFSLALPIFLLLNLLFLIYFAFRKKTYAWWLLAVTLLAMPSFHNWVSFGNKGVTISGEDHFTVMTYNVRMFNVYEWIDAPDVPQSQLNLILQHNPDILGIQEYYKYSQTPNISYPYSFVHLNNQKQTFGQAIYSRFPIVDKGVVNFDQTEGFNNSFIYADIKVRGNIIRVINVHLASFYFDVKDFYRLREADNSDDFQLKVKNLSNQLFKGFRRRSKQLETLAEFIEVSPHSVILMGDMNDAPASYTHKKLRKTLEDSFVEIGSGTGRTYVEQLMPLRIDWVLYDAKFLKPTNFIVVGKDKPLSDHFPVLVTFRLN